MPTAIKLSESAVATLRMEIKGFRSKVKGRRLEAYRELAAAGIMEVVPAGDADNEADYRFTADGIKDRESILERESDRIERERYEPPDASNLSESARDLLRRIVLDNERPEVTPDTKPAYRELAAARIMLPVSGFATGPESSYRFTYWGWHRRHDWIAPHHELPEAKIEHAGR